MDAAKYYSLSSLADCGELEDAALAAVAHDHHLRHWYAEEIANPTFDARETFENISHSAQWREFLTNFVQELSSADPARRMDAAYSFAANLLVMGRWCEKHHPENL
jgi:hypothetical protein